MASVAFDSFIPEVLLEAQGVPHPVLINAIRNACFDFCRDSLWLNYIDAPYAYTAGTQTYALTEPTDCRVVGVLDINIDGLKTIYPWVRDDVIANRPNWQNYQGLIEGFLQLTNDSVSLVAVPNTSGVFTPTVAYAPTRSASTVDKRVYDHHLETIKYGALWKLKSMNNQPWTDLKGAAVNETLFLMGINQAALERQRSNSRATMRVTPVAFV